ncbi:hypothetical protein IWW43_004386 [Coemansia sp. RSA 1935]|nr:hypothetical protein IWW43_004386 [Coemansia sp. RSA 1935]
MVASHFGVTTVTALAHSRVVRCSSEYTMAWGMPVVRAPMYTTLSGWINTGSLLHIVMYGTACCPRRFVDVSSSGSWYPAMSPRTAT